MKFEYRPETDTLTVRLTSRAAGCADAPSGVCEMAGVTVFHNEKDEPLKLEIGCAQEFVKDSLDNVFREEGYGALRQNQPNPVTGLRFSFSPDVDILCVMMSTVFYDYAEETEGVAAHYDASGQPVMLEIMDGRDFVLGAIAATLGKTVAPAAVGQPSAPAQAKPRQTPAAAD